jgi:hypothetical protein
VRIWPNTEQPPPSHPPPLIHLVKASCVDSSLRGEAPAYTTAAGGVLGVGASSDVVPTTVEGRLSRSLITGFPSVVSTAVSGQIGFLSSHRSRRKKSRHKWCTIGWAWAHLAVSHGGASCSLFHRHRWRKKSPSRPSFDQGPRLEWGCPFIFIKFWASKREPMTEIDPLCRRLMRRNRGLGPWDRGPILRYFQ